MHDIIINGIMNGILGLILFGLALFFTDTKLSDFIHENSKKIWYFILSGIIFGFILDILIGIPVIIDGNGSFIFDPKGINDTIICLLVYGFCFFTMAAFEEFLFRGYILKKFLNKFSPIISITLESLIFSLLHFINYSNSNTFYIDLINAFLIGVFLSIMALSDNSLTRCIGFHLSCNVFELLLYPDNKYKFNRLIYYNVYNNNKLFMKYIEYFIIIIASVILLVKNQIIKSNKFI